MSFNHVWFDLDGTLIDSAPAILSSFELAFRSLGILPVRAIELDVIGPPLRETLELLSGTSAKALIEPLASAFMASYDTFGYRETVVFDGVHELLSEARSYGLELAIATNKRINPTLLILDHLGLSKHFSRVVALDSFSPHLKNKREMLGRLLSDSAVHANDVIYVGDRLEDGAAASDNGLAFVAATWGYGAIQQEKLHPAWDVALSPAQLVDLLRGRMNLLTGDYGF